MRARGFVIVLAAAAVIAAIVLSSGGGDDDGGGGGTIAPGGSTQAQRDAPAGSVPITFAYSPEKEVLLEPLIRQFNSEQQDVSVNAQVIASGEAQRQIAAGRLKPTVWSPASSLWGRLLEFEADRKLVADENPSIVRTPLVIAMWEPLARALGWPKRQVGFGEILRLATGTEGWAKYGRPEFGKFKLGHTNPDFSTSGLSAVAAEYFAVTGKREGLTEQDVTSERVRRRVRRIEQSIVHYGDTTLFFADQLERYGPAFASAVAMEEATLIEYNRRKPGDTKLVGLYPREGTFFSDNPYLVLDAEWVTPEQREAAATFQTWLAEKITPELAARGGFRPGDPDVAPVAPIDAANGADPKQPRRVLQPPQPRVLARVKAAWREDRKPANVMVVVDVSGSMSEGGKLDQAKQGLRAFFKQISPRDRVGIITFSDEVNQALPVSTFGENEQRIRQVVDDLFPGGETAVIDATKQGFEAVRKLDDETRINAVVALTDGEDNSSKTTPEELERLLEGQSRSEGLAVRVFTIAYGGEANRDLLDGLASASGGKGFAGDPEGIESVYLSISSFF